jgi:prepilin-type N-terminal cleavage/methylation domain-containing protein
MRTLLRPDGFTLVEVLLAAILLAVGVGAILTTSARTVDLVLRGRLAARAMHAATARVEEFRLEAGAAPACSTPSTGADTGAEGTVRRWEFSPGAGVSDVLVWTTIPVPGGQRTDSLVAGLRCP